MPPDRPRPTLAVRCEHTLSNGRIVRVRPFHPTLPSAPSLPAGCRAPVDSVAATVCVDCARTIGTTPGEPTMDSDATRFDVEPAEWLAVVHRIGGRRSIRPQRGSDKVALTNGMIDCAGSARWVA